MAGLSVPYRVRGGAAHPTDLSGNLIFKDRFFYQLYFQDAGVAERELEADVRTALRKIYYSVWGDAPSAKCASRRRRARVNRPTDDPERFRAWMSEADLDYFIRL